MTLRLNYLSRLRAEGVRALAVLLFAALVWFSPGPTSAQEAAEAARDRQITAADKTLDAIRSDIDENAPIDVRATENRLRGILRESRARLGPVNRALESAIQSRDQLGPPPKEGEPPESEPLAKRREELTQRISILQGQRTRILSNIENAGSLIATLSTRRVALLYSNLLEPGPSLFAPELWGKAITAGEELGRDIIGFFSAWAEKASAPAGPVMRLGLLAVAFVISFLLIGPAHRWMQKTFVQHLTDIEPTPGRRVAVAGIKMMSRLAPGIVGGFIIIETARGVGLLDSVGMPVAHAIWMALIAALLVEGFTSGLFAPSAPGWRIAGLEAAKGRHASRLLLAIVVIFGFKTVAESIAAAADADPSFSRLLAGVSALAIGVLLILLCRRSLWKMVAAKTNDEKQTDEPSLNVWRHVRRAGLLIGVAILAAVVIGYIPLADFIASRFYYLALILAVAWFARAALKELVIWIEIRLRPKSEEQARDDKQIARFWIGAGVDFLLLIIIAPALLVLAGFSWRSVRDLVANAFMGFRIGGVTISFADIFWAIGLFFLILAATRFVQRGLERGPFAHSRLDTGVQNSLTTIIGYIGLLLAFVASITALGFDLSNLALIAGALSVGIGFGLQSIVNNFVSGLILLFERPIKVGDWVVTASGEGIVKKISVRSTEIETFDRSAIIVPNSELISSTVTNWTHRSKLGRISVPVGVSYSSDPEKVKEILLRCAKNHPLVAGFPEPFVVWKDFGNSSLDFQVRVYLRDIGDCLTVGTELRFSIFKELKEAGIEIPFPQNDIYIKSWPQQTRSDLAEASAADNQASPNDGEK